jgi:hypothetical protein
VLAAEEANSVLSEQQSRAGFPAVTISDQTYDLIDEASRIVGLIDSR